MTAFNVKVTGLGAYNPPHVVENTELVGMVDTSDEWIQTRTGICRRHVSTGETVLDMAEAAAAQAIGSSGLKPEDIGLVIVATSSPDKYFPMAATLLRGRLGMGEGPGFDLSAGCTGFLYALSAAASMMQAMNIDHALVVGSEMLTRIVDWTDRATCVLFGDGAGAFVLSRGEPALEAVYLNARSDDAGMLGLNALPVRNPWIQEQPEFDQTFHMGWQDVFRFAVEAVPDAIKAVAERSGHTLEDVDWVVPHQANQRIIHAAMKALGIPAEKWYINVADHGNTGAASIPIALAEMRERGLLKAGQRLALVAFGAGFAWGSAWLTWAMD